VSPVEVGLLTLFFMLILIWLGFHVGVVLALLSFLGVWAIKGQFAIANKMLALATYDAIASHVFGVIPLFVLMGLLVSEADIGRDAFSLAHRLLGRFRGGLGIATVAANTLFAAITGISIASAAVFTKVAVPEMLRFGYTPRFSVGVVAGSSVLGMLIPPSLLLIVYGLLSEQSIGALFLAGIVPGLLLAAAFAALILGLAHFRPELVQREPAEVTDSEAAAHPVRVLLPIAALVTLVLGGIYGGFFTPMEAGAVGALGALSIALAKRKLSWQSLWRVLVETGHVTVAVSFLLIAASLYARMLTLSGIPQALLGALAGTEWGFPAMLIAYLAILIVLGTVLDSTSILLVTVPLALPLMGEFDVDLVWFGIVTVVAIEIGLLTPPLGLSVYVIHGSLDDERIALADVFWGAAPFALVMLVVLVALTLFPMLSLAPLR
jgi:tripartite ATP-independent transporter DctM subunit